MKAFPRDTRDWLQLIDYLVECDGFDCTPAIEPITHSQLVYNLGGGTNNNLLWLLESVCKTVPLTKSFGHNWLFLLSAYTTVHPLCLSVCLVCVCVCVCVRHQLHLICQSSNLVL